MGTGGLGALEQVPLFVDELRHFLVGPVVPSSRRHSINARGTARADVGPQWLRGRLQVVLY